MLQVNHVETNLIYLCVNVPIVVVVAAFYILSRAFIRVTLMSILVQVRRSIDDKFLHLGVGQVVLIEALELFQQL